MALRMLLGQLLFLFLVLGTAMSWSQRQHHQPKKVHSSHEVEVGSQEDAIESKVRPHYAKPHKPESRFILEEDDHYPNHGQHSPHHEEEYVDSEEHKGEKEQVQKEGHESSDKTDKDHEYDDHNEKGAHQKFEQGGSTFEKHSKDHKADNKELENVAKHDEEAKFGSEALKEHKLGKNREKSKGHKTHGFKNVYHKEEYGDHKTFHDEFLDTDHLHNYDDQHEHKEMQGGKFSKGFKVEGKNKKYDKGDEKREWGKEGHDANHEGGYEKGGHSSKHHQGTKKHRGHHQADYENNKHSHRKIKKGNPPSHVPHLSHHGPHQAQIQPYVPHHNLHHEATPSAKLQPFPPFPHQGHDEEWKPKGEHHHSHENRPHHHDAHHHNHDAYSHDHEDRRHSHDHHHDHGDHHHQHHGHRDDHHSSHQDGHHHSALHSVEDGDKGYEERAPYSPEDKKMSFDEQPEDRSAKPAPIKPELKYQSEDRSAKPDLKYSPPSVKTHGPVQYSQPLINKEQQRHYKHPENERTGHSHYINDDLKGKHHNVRYGFQEPRTQRQQHFENHRRFHPHHSAYSNPPHAVHGKHNRHHQGSFEPRNDKVNFHARYPFHTEEQKERRQRYMQRFYN